MDVLVSNDGGGPFVVPFSDDDDVVVLAVAVVNTDDDDGGTTNLTEANGLDLTVFVSTSLPLSVSIFALVPRGFTLKILLKSKSSEKEEEGGKEEITNQIIRLIMNIIFLKSYSKSIHS